MIQFRNLRISKCPRSSKAWKAPIWCKIGPSSLACHETEYTKLNLQKRILVLFSERNNGIFYHHFQQNSRKVFMKSQVFFVVGFLDTANGTSFHTPQNRWKSVHEFSKHLCDESGPINLVQRTGAECIVTFIKIHRSFNHTLGVFSGWEIYQPWIGCFLIETGDLLIQVSNLEVKLFLYPYRKTRPWKSMLSFRTWPEMDAPPSRVSKKPHL